MKPLAHTPPPSKLVSLARIIVSLALVLISGRAQAAFHLWEIDEIYSNADGSVQYIELVTSNDSQNVLAGHTLIATSDGNEVTFTFPDDLASSSTADKRLLLATPNFANLTGGVIPDYTLPCGPFFDPTAAAISLNFAGVDTVSFAATDLPSDAAMSVNASLVAQSNTPTNFAGTSGALLLSACQSAGTCDPCDDGIFCNGAETCSASACTTAPTCPGQGCDESIDACIDCATAADCDDGNLCTDNTCNPDGSCTATNRAEATPCDDGNAATEMDQCTAAGVCQGSVPDKKDGGGCSAGPTNLAVLFFLGLLLLSRRGCRQNQTA
ncbi:MAG: hypothetical protein R3C68_01545 [Myxococcota bacterium]